MASRQQEQQHNNNNAASQESHNHGSLCLSLMLSHPACLAAAGCGAAQGTRPERGYRLVWFARIMAS